jgi:signal recognition particle subunit SRP68
MELKQDSNTEARKKFHMLSRLKKAIAYADNLVKIAQESTRIDARTKLECEAYSAFIHATHHFEREHWKEAMTAYKKTQYNNYFNYNNV